ncbi:uncharacterized protein LOC105220482 [Zeugodacus cucurbitae]|uniref:uncharacterized protein LOC105220482 n=1 Tax=Zeugodacus cucurbitae TaxID=28588 RepID=UPI0023D9047A|nr:uncharacterized protein LOC105220482 [Zeugodacus cucurbitae]
MSAKECKIKWKSLRDKYRKIKNFENLLSGSQQKLGPAWKCAASMEFLAESMEPASTTSNVSADLDTWDGPKTAIASCRTPPAPTKVENGAAMVSSQKYFWL